MGFRDLRVRDQLTFVLAAVGTVVVVALVLVAHFTKPSGRPVTTADGRTLVVALETTGGMCPQFGGCDNVRVWVYDDNSYSVTTLHGNSVSGLHTGNLTPAEAALVTGEVGAISFPENADHQCASWITNTTLTLTVVTKDGAQTKYSSCDYTIPPGDPLVALLVRLSRISVAGT